MAMASGREFAYDPARPSMLGPWSSLESPPPPSAQARLLSRLAMGAVLFALVSATYAAWHQYWTYDEPVHLAWSERLLDSRIAERDSQERFNTKTPVMLPHVVCRKLLARLGVVDQRALRFATRLPTLLCLAALLWATHAIAYRWRGATAAALAVVAVSLDPNLVAHGSLATVDMPYTLASLLTLGAALRFARGPSLAGGAAIGLALGFALVAKFSAVLLLGGLLLLPLARERRANGARARLPLLAGSGLLALATGMAVICGAYLFLQVGEPLGRIELRSFLGRYAKVWPDLALPLPAAFITGLDRSLAFERNKLWNAYLLGQLFPRGVFYYFAVLWLLKTPLLALGAQGLGLLRAARLGALSSPPGRYLALNGLLTLIYFSLFFHAQLGYRFVLTCIPIAWMLAAAGLAPLLARRAAGWGLAVAALASAGENLAYFGNPLSFSNAVVWPKHQVFRLMADSNLDWGQNRDKIDGWLAKRPPTHLDPAHLLPGHNTFGLNDLAGISGFERRRWLRENASPAGHLGHTYLWFNLGDQLFQRYLDEQRRYAPSALGPELCPPELPLTRLEGGEKRPFSVAESPARGTSWIACVSTRKGMDFGLRSGRGSLQVGHLGANQACRPEMIHDRQILWYRLEPGLHAFCVAELPLRRPWLGYRFEGEWMVRGRPASLNIREAPVKLE